MFYTNFNTVLGQMGQQLARNGHFLTSREPVSEKCQQQTAQKNLEEKTRGAEPTKSPAAVEFG